MKAVANAPDSEHESRLARVVLDLVAEPIDVRIDRVFIAVGVANSDDRFAQHEV